MPGDTFQRVQSGQPFNTHASTWNAMLDAAEAHRQNDAPIRTPGADSRQATVVSVKNNSGSDQSRLAVLAVDGPIISPTDNANEFKGRVAVKGVLPAHASDHQGKFVVLAEPIKSGAIGRAYAAGVCPAKINIEDADHTTVEVVDGEAKLETTSGGSATILWKESGTGDDKYAVIRFAAPQPSSFHPPQGRLFIEQGDASGSLLQYLPDVGNQVWTLSGGTWHAHEIDLVPSPSTQELSNLGLSADTNYDVFAYWDADDPTPALKLESVAWSSGSARATELDRQDAAYVKTGDSSRLYVGTIRVNSDGDFADHAKERFVWNAYNRRPLTLFHQVDDGEFSTTSSDAEAAFGFVHGLDDLPVQLGFVSHGKLDSGASADAIAHASLSGISSASLDGCAAFTQSESFVPLSARVDYQHNGQGLRSIGFNWALSSLGLGASGTAIFTGDGTPTVVSGTTWG